MTETDTQYNEKQLLLNNYNVVNVAFRLVGSCVITSEDVQWKLREAL